MVVQLSLSAGQRGKHVCDCEKKKREEEITALGINVMRSQILYQAAQWVLEL